MDDACGERGERDERGIQRFSSMKRTSMDVDTLSVRSRIVLFHNTTVSASKAISFEDEELNYNLFLSSGVTSVNILVAGIAPTQLKARGFECASKMRNVGFDALHLVNPAFCNTMNLAFGKANILEHFLVTPQDAVSLAGSQAVSILKIEPKQLLERCICAPSHAAAVLKQLPQTSALSDVPAELLLDCGLRLQALANLGFTVETIVRCTHASPFQLQKLGFAV